MILTTAFLGEKINDFLSFWVIPIFAEILKTYLQLAACVDPAP